MNRRDKILWVDDEIDLLRPYVIFLQEKNYDVTLSTNGQDAIEMCQKQHFDIIFLDENMPGISGLETLTQIKQIDASVPIVMITKSEEENLMDMAIGNKIADYLIKPVNPKQILLALKKNIHKKDIIQEQATSNYRSDFAQIGMQINDSTSCDSWMDIYRKLVFWELELANTHNEMDELLMMQKSDANNMFAKFIKKEYATWFEQPENRPLISPDLFKKKVFPLLDKGEKVFFLLIDNFRFDQWRIIRDNILSQYFTIAEDDLYYSILPTATQYARNAIFSGLMPLQLQKTFPNLWIEEEGDENKNQNEEALIASQIKRFCKPYTFSYRKVNNSAFGEKMVELLPQILRNDLNICVLNFIDMLSHARTESQMIRELANNEEAYRSLTLSWFEHSFAHDLFRELAKHNVKLIITTDHGAVKVTNPVKVVGDKNTNVNLRYKVSKSLSYNEKEVFEIRNPEKFGLPSPNVSSTYVFATKSDFFAYPNNYNYYVNYYKDTVQHGGISLEEMLVPIATLEAKR
jgi:DNA-binding response OmpR family regulator